MRIIAGDYRGRLISALPGKTTRPSTDRVREAWASSIAALAAAGFDGQNVLDAFAGSGALGLEALSRGARTVALFERDRRAFATLSQNIAQLGLAGDGRVLAYQADVFSPRALRLLAGQAPFSLVFFDPPYAYAPARLAALAVSLSDARLLADGCLFSYERETGGQDRLDGIFAAQAKKQAGSKQGPAPPEPYQRRLEMVSCKRYGRTTLEYYRLCT
ncbi:MAG: RsmD family RNA methyltransferase [Coriobacteriia bacterium]|nr:RsmD family RNA methyltransferase [Coriobacteriia bacterium]